MSLLSVLLSQASALVNPNCHLRTLSPHADFGDLALIGAEHLEHRLNVSYCSITAKGFGGSNVHAITWGSSQDKPVEPPRGDFKKKRLVYWPGGGGELDYDVVPRKKAGYFIAGTWNRWRPEQMDVLEDGLFGYVMVLGENRWEKFQIWLDGDEKRKLYPAQQDSAKGREVLGPAEDAMGMKWCIDGRSWAEEEDPSQIGNVHIDHGRAGDKYRIHLRIAGKYRTVDWEKIRLQDGTAPERAPQGTYGLWASWNGWILEEMFRDDSDPSVHHVEVTLTDATGYFAIVRNEDMEQVVYPDRFAADESATVLGPDQLVEELFWCIHGRPGDVFRIEFQRRIEFGLDSKKVSWSKVIS